MALWEMLVWVSRRPCGSVHRERECVGVCWWVLIWMQVEKARSTFKYHWPYMHAIHPKLNYLNRIWTSAPGWGCHGYQTPQYVSLYRASETLQIGRCEFQRYSVKCCVVGTQHRAAAARHESYLTRRDRADPDPLANLGCRQHRALSDLNQSVKVSPPPNLLLLQGFHTPSLPPSSAPPTWHPAFLYKGSEFFVVPICALKGLFFTIIMAHVWDDQQSELEKWICSKLFLSMKSPSHSGH